MKTVLFVCFHNEGRSQMAEAFVNHLAKERGLSVRAVSTGAVPSRDINPVAAAAMNEVGIPLAGQRPKMLKQADIDYADRVITMHCGVEPTHCPSGLPDVARTGTWRTRPGSPLKRCARSATTSGPGSKSCWTRWGAAARRHERRQ